MGHMPGGPRSAKGQDHLQSRDPPLPSLLLLSSLSFLLLGPPVALSTLLTACTLALVQISMTWPKDAQATSPKACPTQIVAFYAVLSLTSVLLLAGLFEVNLVLN